MPKEELHQKIIYKHYVGSVIGQKVQKLLKTFVPLSSMASNSLVNLALVLSVLLRGQLFHDGLRGGNLLRRNCKCGAGWAGARRVRAVLVGASVRACSLQVGCGVVKCGFDSALCNHS